jgi:hypothetical protein
MWDIIPFLGYGAYSDAIPSSAFSRLGKPLYASLSQWPFNHNNPIREYPLPQYGIWSVERPF